MREAKSAFESASALTRAKAASSGLSVASGALEKHQSEYSTMIKNLRSGASAKILRGNWRPRKPPTHVGAGDARRDILPHELDKWKKDNPFWKQLGFSSKEAHDTAASTFQKFTGMKAEPWELFHIAKYGFKKEKVDETAIAQREAASGLRRESAQLRAMGGAVEEETVSPWV
jgi:hypothetical protein